jgi:hypothetical protein
MRGSLYPCHLLCLHCLTLRYRVKFTLYVLLLFVDYLTMLFQLRCYGAQKDNSDAHEKLICKS